ncbi:MAG: PQQ-binding-like beta-propeller repeat protein [bacterium]|nr:PQQ-binding-like beta-propeller repeat protein [bacterium]
MPFLRHLCFGLCTLSLTAAASFADTSDSADNQPSPSPSAPATAIPETNGTPSPAANNAANNHAPLGEEIYVFRPQLLWTNASAPLLFPIHWMAATSQGMLLAGSLFSKTFYVYNLLTGECRARQSLAAPSWASPLVIGQTAVFNDTNATVSSFNSETCESEWERVPHRPRRRSGDLRLQFFRPRVCKTKPLLFNDKLVSMDTDGRVTFYPNKSPEEGGMPDFLTLTSSPDELGTFLNTPAISRQILYACTSVGHLHFVNLNNIAENGMLKVHTGVAEVTTEKEVRVPVLTASRFIYVTTMDGTVYCYRAFRKYSSSKYIEPTLVWQTKLAGQSRYQSNRRGRPIVMPVLDETQSTLFVCAKDCVQALDAETGEILWKHSVPQGIAAPPLLWKQYLLIVSEKQSSQPAKLAALSPDSGETLNFHELSGSPSCEPLLWGNYLVLGYRNGYAECYHLGEAENSDNS